MQTFIPEIQHLKAQTETKSFWTFINCAILISFVVTSAIIVFYIIRYKCNSDYSLCLRRVVNEHETTATVLKLPTNDDIDCKTTVVTKQSVTLSNGSSNITSKEQELIGQTDDNLARPKLGKVSKKSSS